jgi:hypothetical protein
MFLEESALMFIALMVVTRTSVTVSCQAPSIFDEPHSASGVSGSRRCSTVRWTLNSARVAS